jgi:polyadenylate-binding protein
MTSVPVQEALQENIQADKASLSEDCTLYVGDLDFLVTEAHLFELFSTFGQIKSIRVVKDAVTRTSLGYAFVNYITREAAQQALRDQSPKLLNGRLCRVLPFQKDPSQRREANIFIKNLDSSISSAALFETFSVFGRILSCKVATDEFGTPKGFAYISFETKSSAEEAIARMNGVLMNDRKVYVGYHIPKWERLSRLEQMKINYTNLFVKNVNPDVSEREFTELFTACGPIESVSLPQDANGAYRGFGFVNFQNHEDAVKAVQTINDHEFHGRTLYVSRAQKKYEREEELRQQYEQSRMERQTQYEGINLYVKFLDPSIDDQQLREVFAPFGTITSAKIMTDDNGNSRGFGFVCYSNAQEAQIAIAEMNEKELLGNKLYVALAQRRDHRKPMFARAPFLPLGGSRQFNQAQFIPPAFYYPIAQPNQFLGPAPTTPRAPLAFRPFLTPPRTPLAPAAVAAAAAAVAQIPNPNFGYFNMARSRSQTPNGYKRNGKPSNQKNKFGKGNQEYTSSLAAAVASAANPEAETQVIGEAIYPRVLNHPAIKGDQETAGKITGMLLEQDKSDLLKWVDDVPALDKIIQQAYNAFMEFVEEQATM